MLLITTQPHHSSSNVLLFFSLITTLFISLLPNYSWFLFHPFKTHHPTRDLSSSSPPVTHHSPHPSSLLSLAFSSVLFFITPPYSTSSKLPFLLFSPPPYHLSSSAPLILLSLILAFSSLFLLSLPFIITPSHSLTTLPHPPDHSSSSVSLFTASPHFLF